MNQPTTDLPVARCLPEIVAAVSQSRPVVLKAPPGAGKTTGVPPALLTAGIAKSGQIVLVQPRRLAARSAAHRIAHLLGADLGKDVGYHVRFDRRATSSTKILAMTTGVLLRRLSSDPLLENAACVILDEFHERSLEMDLVLGMLERIRTTLREDLKLVVMSATLDPTPIVDFLGDATAVTSEGRAYPVDIHYSKSLSRDRIEQQITDVLPDVLRSTAGHVLVFLPGVGEIRRTQRAIEQQGLHRDAVVMPLYGDLSPQDQDAVMAPSDRRKIILATNVAETSVTIPGVTGVIDSGQARVMRFEANVGMPALRLEPISQASAQQRSGRAGRTEPGVCWRLWPANSHRSRRERETPEIERNDFSAAMLTLAAWGERDPADFPWLTPPPPASVHAADKLLRGLGAIDDDASVTAIGMHMLALPLHPRLARFMVAAAQRGVAQQAAIAAALLTERDPFRGADRPIGTIRGRQSNLSHDRADSLSDSHAPSDIVDRVEKLQAFADGDSRIAIQVGVAKQVQRVAKQLLRLVPKAAIAQADDPTKSVDRSDEESLMRALLAAYPDRVARRRNPGSDRGVMVGQRGVKLDSRSVVRSSELFLCIDVDSKGTEALVRAASAVQVEWLDERLIRWVDEPFFNPTTRSVVARRRCYFDDLLLSESPIECKPCETVGQLLFQQARKDIERLFSSKDKEISHFIARVRFVTQHLPELSLPALDQEGIESVLLQLCQSRTSIDELGKAPWLDHFRGRYSYDQLQVIEQNAPDRMTVPSGNSIRIQYADGKPPIMEVRIQELFGWKETPQLAGGQVPLQLHLLGPNRRPQQITEDLANFWSSTYGQVRKDLRRRYPKHHWPEDPTTAKATHNGLKPRS
ncbi:MAG: ATP-dependent helicase HrpB [Pirellulaceae bacterium]|nr:ATP-dependent helicase HrpB [Pirellulaceae bacterium]